jgi:hypothetical protein
MDELNTAESKFIGYQYAATVLVHKNKPQAWINEGVVSFRSVEDAEEYKRRNIGAHPELAEFIPNDTVRSQFPFQYWDANKPE